MYAYHPCHIVNETRKLFIMQMQIHIANKKVKGAHLAWHRPNFLLASPTRWYYSSLRTTDFRLLAWTTQHLIGLRLGLLHSTSTPSIKYKTAKTY